jgi:hemolysin activation/secretion protein
MVSIAPAVRAELPNNAGTPENNMAAHFDVETYEVVGGPKISMDVVFPILAKYTGTNVSSTEIVEAAFALQAEYHKEGFPKTSVAIAREQITNGVVIMNVFQAASPQIIVSGVRYYSPTNAAMAVSLPPSAPAPAPETVAAAPAAAPAVPPPPSPLSLAAPVIAAKPISPKEMAAAQAALSNEIFKLDTEGPDTRIHVVSTNAGPRFPVEHYVIMGNSVLTSQTIAATITNIDGAFGTNVSFEGIQAVVDQLQQAYHDRGYTAVRVTVPHQKLTNETVKIEVLEGRLWAIDVVGNHYFSSNNVMRALPGLRTNMVIDEPVLIAEINRANANQDRQILPVGGTGPEPGTTVLTLRVKDRLPLHAKIDLDNQNSPGTPDLRINTSAVYNNLWQLEHSIGVQYSFSPEQFKPGDWNFYDRPAVANYSAFYRLPLGNPVSLEDRITANPGSFGFDEATRKFNLPPAGNSPSFTLFASRSTIDSGTTTTLDQMLSPPGSNPSLSRVDTEHSPEITEDVAGRLDYPLTTSGSLQSSFSGGLDYKFYQLFNYKTNTFTIVQTNFDQNGNPMLPPVTSVVPSIVPATENQVNYLPLSFHYNGSWNDSYGTSTIGVGVGVNLWYDALFATTSTILVTNVVNGTNKITQVSSTQSVNGRNGLQLITGSAESTGYWVVITPSYSRTIVIHDWTTLLRADGQWASEPLISPEQFGAGGVNSVRGYMEGDVFGDTGYHLSIEEQTPAHLVGMISDGVPLNVRGSVYLDYASVYLIDPQGRPPQQGLCGTGVGFTAAAGSHWQARFLFSWPLISTPDTPAFHPLFDFTLTAQF